MAIATRPSVQEYLAFPFSDQLEYIRGEVLEKPMGNADHGVIASFIFKCFLDYVAHFGGQAGIEGRARFLDPDDPRFMLPDLSLYRRGMRFREGQMLLPPTIAAEVRSPDQTMTKTTGTLPVLRCTRR
jgi:Uma2 family endonuclease